MWVDFEHKVCYGSVLVVHVAVESSFVLILSLSQGIVDGRSSFSAVSSLRLPVPDSLQSARLCKPLLQVPRCNLIRMQTFSSSQHLLENLPGLFGLSPSFPLSASDRFSFRTLAPQGIFMLGFFCFVFFSHSSATAQVDFLFWTSPS